MEIVIVFLLICTIHAEPERDTPSGRVKGLVSSAVSETEAYLGIPYAKPPIGSSRFRRSSPVDPWDETLSATKQPPACPQTSRNPYPWFDSQSSQDEDCLYLNVWVPEGEDNPVMVWLPGGEYFSQGSVAQDAYNASEFIQEYGNAAVVVFVNYRLGALGYFTLGTEDAPGNVGLYDIMLALQWVQSHISSFGGDPNKVTLAGWGDGAILASLFTVTPEAEGLFRYAILQTGTFYPVRNRNLQVNVDVSKALAEELSCTDSEDEESILECMRGKKWSDISSRNYDLSSMYDMPFYPHYGDGLIPADPHSALKSGQINNVSILIGVTREDGAYLMTRDYEDDFGIFGESFSGSIDENFENRMLSNVFKDYPQPENMTEYYSGLDSESRVDRVIQAYTDTKFLCPTEYFAEQFGQHRTVYFYFFDYQSKSYEYRPWADWMGVVHFQDVPFALGRVNSDTNMADRKIGKYALEVWKGFVVQGIPKVYNNRFRFGVREWTSYSKEDPYYYSIEATRFWYFEGPHKENCDFLRDYLE